MRRWKGWSQERLAELLDVSRQTVYKWEAGLSTPTLPKIQTLVQLFDCTFDDLLTDKPTIEIQTNDLVNEKEGKAK